MHIIFQQYAFLKDAKRLFLSIKSHAFSSILNSAYQKASSCKSPQLRFEL